MQRRKIVIATISLLLVGLALPAANIPKAHAFLTNESFNISGLALSDYSDSVITGGSTVNVAASGATVNFNVVVFADNPSTAYQRNVTIGVKFDWMTAYQNATNAGSSNTLTLTANQEASVTVSVAVLSTTGMIPHVWTLLIGDGPQNKVIPPTCANSLGGAGNACFISGGAPVEIWSSDQIGAAQSKLQAETQIGNVNTALGSIRPVLSGANPGITNAAGLIAQAQTEETNGNVAWLNGDYSGAKGHYQNAANDANSAAGALTGAGGGADTAGITNQVLNGIGIALFGVGSLMAGLGGFFYLRRKPKA